MALSPSVPSVKGPRAEQGGKGSHPLDFDILVFLKAKPFKNSKELSKRDAALTQRKNEETHFQRWTRDVSPLGPSFLPTELTAGARGHSGGAGLGRKEKQFLFSGSLGSPRRSQKRPECLKLAHLGANPPHYGPCIWGVETNHTHTKQRINGHLHWMGGLWMAFRSPQFY